MNLRQNSRRPNEGRRPTRSGRRRSVFLVAGMSLGSVFGVHRAEAQTPTTESATATNNIESSDLDRFTTMMIGHFSSAAQAATDPAYYDIQLVMVPIWPERTDGVWLYVEQAVAAAPERPYRQRVYRLSVIEPNAADARDSENREDAETLPATSLTNLKSEVFTLPGDPLDRAGVWRDDAPLADVTPDDLALREGCTIYLRRATPDDANHQTSPAFIGTTRGQGCITSLNGAAYATAEALITADGLETWDRGFFEDGSHAWGAVDGPYRFDRIVTDDPDTAAD